MHLLNAGPVARVFGDQLGQGLGQGFAETLKSHVGLLVVFCDHFVDRVPSEVALVVLTTSLGSPLVIRSLGAIKFTMISFSIKGCILLSVW